MAKKKTTRKKKVPGKKKAPKKKLDNLMNYAIKRFVSDLECIKEMFDIVLPNLKKMDDARKKRIDTIFKTFQSSIKQKKMTKINEVDIKKFNELVNNLNKLFRARRAFEQNSIVMIVSRYDDFLAEFLRLIYKKNPDRLKTTDKSLSYEEILRLGSVGKTLDRIINKEVDSLLYKSHLGQLKFIDKEFKCNIVGSISCVKEFVEITERRNLFVHCGGKISDQYISACKKYKVFLTKKIKEGVQIGVSKDYFEGAYNCLFEIGINLGCSLLRKLFPEKEKLEYLDYSLNNKIVYNLLKKEQWRLANIILGFALGLPKKLISSDEFYKIFVINKCIALKYLGDKKAMEALLNDIDWSASRPVFLLATEALKGNYDKAEAIMKTMNSKQLSEEDVKDWPLFREFRETDNFKRAFKKIYRKDYRPELKKLKEEF